MSDEVIAKVLRYYGVNHTRLLAMQKGYRNESHPAVLADGSKVNLILYKSEPGILQRIRGANSVSDYLSEKGFPTRSTADSRVVQLSSGPRARYAALYSYLPGATIPWEAYTMQHLKLLGKTMSDMHTALEDLPTDDLYSVADEYKKILGRMQQYFARREVSAAMKTKLGLAVSPTRLNQYGKLIRYVETLGGQQVLHMDFVRGNVLFAQGAAGPQISGILDFEKTSYGHKAFDIARTLAFLLVDCKYKKPEKVRKYFLQSGYNKRGSASFKNVRLLDELMSLFLLYDFYKFLRHNPYEFLEQNEHFTRTSSILLQRGLLATDR